LPRGVVQDLLIDSGPLVALFDRSDNWHERVASYLKTYRGQLHASAATVTEAAWITSSASHQMLINLLAWLERGAVTVHNVEAGDFGRIATLATRYRSLRPDFADLALLALAERLKTDRILTLDQRDFAVYRLRNGRPLRNTLSEWLAAR
jgi:predicted nucleic acid-binding protein